MRFDLRGLERAGCRMDDSPSIRNAVRQHVEETARKSYAINSTLTRAPPPSSERTMRSGWAKLNSLRPRNCVPG
jgi:hypothetical protein